MLERGYTAGPCSNFINEIDNAVALQIMSRAVLVALTHIAKYV